MRKIRANAVRHQRQPHYHHRIPVHSAGFRPRYFHCPCIGITFPGCTEVHASMNTAVTNEKKNLKKHKKKHASKPKKKHGKHYDLKRFLAKLVIVALIIWAVLKYVFGVMILYGNYMFPAVRDGDLVITYKLQDPITNDLVLYEHDGVQYVGRVVAKENAVIRYDSETETYSVNGVTPTEEIFYTTTTNPDADIEYPYTVPEGCVYVLCDHREDYTDSRTYEAIPTSEIQGVVIFVIRRRGF